MDKEKDFLDSIIESVIAIDKEDKIREINQATPKLLGYKKDEILGKPIENFCKNISLKNIRGSLPLEERELTYLNKEGKEIPVSVNITNRISYPDDIILIARDISKVKDLIGELTQSQKELRNSYEQLQSGKDDLVRSEKLAYTGRIAANIAHEIRNPLANVSMSVQQVKKAFNQGEKGTKYIEIIERNIERINFLITELLNSARPVKLDLRVYNIHKVIKGILESDKTRIKLQGIKVIKDFTRKTAVLKIDRAQIERAFTNIIGNAIESMPKGGTLTILTEYDGGCFLVKIKDTGKGIRDEDVIRIFEPFFSTRPQGVGLGLTICYGVIVSHGGTIEVESEPKKGSTFTVSLPPPPPPPKK